MTALQGLSARKVRTVLVLFGPALGVAALVGVLGLSESARGDVRASLRELGTDLLVVDAISASGNSRLPAESLERVRSVSSVESVTKTSTIAGVDIAVSREAQGTTSLTQTLQIQAAEPELLGVLGIEMTHGRFLNAFDDSFATQGVVLGADAAGFLAAEPGEPRTVLLNGELFAILGVVDSTKLLPELNRSMFISYGSAREKFGDSGAPGRLFVRTTDGTTEETAAFLPRAITFGGPGEPAVRVPTDLLQARAQVDSAFRAIVFALGALSLFVGGIGIANVMTISVLQRSGEIGIRRALGHTRAIVGGQFMLEAAVIGAAGGVVGVLAGIAFVAIAADYQGWVLVLSPLPIIGAGFLAIAVSVLAGIYPALRAARMEPLEALRL